MVETVTRAGTGPRTCTRTAPAAAAGRGDFPRKSAMLALDQLRFHPRNVRKTYTDLDELAGSIREQGVLQPLLAHRRWITPPGQTEVVELLAGHRRLMAAEIAGLRRVPVIVRPRVDDDQALLGMLAEDQKDPLDAGERRDAVVALHEEFCWDLREIGVQLGLDVATVRALYEGLDVAPGRTVATPPARPAARKCRRPSPRIAPTRVHDLVTAWDAGDTSGADVVAALRTMLGDWTPGPAAGTTLAAPADGGSASGGSTPRPLDVVRTEGGPA